MCANFKTRIWEASMAGGYGLQEQPCSWGRTGDTALSVCGLARALLLEQCPGPRLRLWAENHLEISMTSTHWWMEDNTPPKVPGAGFGLPHVWCEKSQVPEGFRPPQAPHPTREAPRPSRSLSDFVFSHSLIIPSHSGLLLFLWSCGLRTFALAATAISFVKNVLPQVSTWFFHSPPSSLPSYHVFWTKLTLTTLIFTKTSPLPPHTKPPSLIPLCDSPQCLSLANTQSNLELNHFCYLLSLSPLW